MAIKLSQKGILDKIEKLRSSEFEEIETLFLEKLGLNKWPAKQDDQIIQQILPKNLNDPKDLAKEFYIAQFVCLKQILSKYFISEEFIAKISKLELPKQESKILRYGILLQNFLSDLVFLYQELNLNIIARPIEGFKMLKNIFETPDMLFRNIPIILTGINSIDQHFHQQADIVASIIRQSLELRLRRGLGVIGMTDKVQNASLPLSLSRILNVTKEFKDDIFLGAPIENIQRIYGWANVYMHIGMKNYIWVLLFVTDYLNPLMLGKDVSPSHAINIHAGIQFTKKIHENFISAMEESIKSLNDNYELIKTRPEAFIIKK